MKDQIPLPESINTEFCKDKISVLLGNVNTLALSLSQEPILLRSTMELVPPVGESCQKYSACTTIYGKQYNHWRFAYDIRFASPDYSYAEWIVDQIESNLFNAKCPEEAAQYITVSTYFWQLLKECPQFVVHQPHCPPLTGKVKNLHVSLNPYLKEYADIDIRAYWLSEPHEIPLKYTLDITL